MVNPPTLRRGAPAMLVAGLVVLASTATLAAELQERTRLAYEAYLEEAVRRFLHPEAERTPRPAGPAAAVRAGPAREDGIMKVPGGLIHHWRATTFVPEVSVDDLVAVSRDYPDYPRIYRTVLATTVLEENGPTFRLRMRIRESGGGITAVYRIHSTVRYTTPAPGTVHVLSHADEIREIWRPGTPDEYLMPAGNDSGYLWRANTFTRLIAREDGVFVEMQTLGLSRGFPPLLGWLIEPIARRVGRRSVEATLEEFVTASLTRGQSAASGRSGVAARIVAEWRIRSASMSRRS